jgi:class 3 adenylate cyclase
MHVYVPRREPRDRPRDTFLFTDIQGSTKLLRHLGDRYADVLSEHQRLLRQSWAKHGGVEVDTAAAAATRALAEHSWPEGATPGRP